ncbi:probable G-protein coupled receptor 21 [Apostichopus japonicus]|uniref:probable G-protein coupled receptor 21 n=1 Tax=Stichopus japonicus TaxID=307972 RepID=UPI003AB1B0D5
MYIYKAMDEDSYSIDGGDGFNDTCANHQEFKKGDCAGVWCSVASVVICIIASLAIFGNILNIFVLTSGKFLSKPHVYFLTSLAFSDLIIGVINLFAIYPSIEHDWPFSHLLCKLTNYVREVVLEVSILMMLCLNIERYIVISYPIRHRIWLSRKRCKMIIVVCWVLTLAGKIVLFFDDVFITEYNDDVYVCVTKYERNQKMAFFSVLVVEIPVLVILTLSSVKLMVTLHLANQRRSTMLAHRSTKQRKTSTSFKLKGDMKSYKMLIVIATITFVTLIPSLSLRIIYILKGCETVRDRFSWALEFSFFWLASFGSFANVFVFSYMDKNFFKCLKKLCTRCNSSADDQSVPVRPRRTSRELGGEIPEEAVHCSRITLLSDEMKMETISTQQTRVILLSTISNNKL